MATTGTELTRAAAALIDAYNRADWEAFRASITSDVGYTETGTGRHLDGADAFVELCLGWKAAFRDATGVVRSAITSGDVVAQEVVWEATHTGPLQTAEGIIEATGNRIHVAAVMWYRYEGDRAREIHHYLDVLGLLQQVQGTAAPVAQLS
jgi:steroid delta-isomerase-like uncharacterized protein